MFVYVAGGAASGSKKVRGHTEMEFWTEEGDARLFFFQKYTSKSSSQINQE